MTYALIEADVVRYLRGNQWLAQNGYIEKAHAVLSDPPYGLAFMGKHWDTLGPVEFRAWVTEWATLLIDFVHPGAVGLFFGGTRTYHRLASGLEDAGWEISDSLMWVYGSGFPKSAAIDKLLDKEAGARWSGYGTALKPAYEPVVVARAPRGKRTYAALAREFGTGALNIDGGRVGTADNLDRPACYYENGADSAHFEPRPWMTERREQGLPIRPATLGSPAGRWPANFGLVCECAGDDHADDCPVAVLGERSGVSGGGVFTQTGKRAMRDNPIYGKPNETRNAPDNYGDVGSAARFFYQAKAAAWEREAGLRGFSKRAMREPGAEFGKMTMWNGENGDEAWKAKNPNNPRANIHPTVKPIRLAEYLARLILPPEGDEPRRLLVPFAGSGSEMIGALLAGWDVVTGIEREAEYVELARARVGWWAQFATVDEARKAWDRAKREPKIIPAPVVMKDKPAQLALFEEAAS